MSLLGCLCVCLPDCLFACLVCPCCGVIVLCIVQLFVWVYFVPHWCASFTFNCWLFLAWSCLHSWPCLRVCCFCWLRSFIRRTSIACMSALAAHMIKYQPVVIKQQVVPLFHPLPRTPLNHCPNLLSFNAVCTLAPFPSPIASNLVQCASQMPSLRTFGNKFWPRNHRDHQIREFLDRRFFV